MPEPTDKLREISQAFQIHGDLLHSGSCQIGHINETYVAAYNQGGSRVRYLHQRINRNVFKDPAAVMRNIVRVTNHVREKLRQSGVGETSRRCLTVVPTRTGQSYFVDAEGEYWRTYVFVERARTYAAVRTPAQAYQAGAAFGEFQSLLADLGGRPLIETIPRFHDTRSRFEAFRLALREDAHRRAKTARNEIAFALQRERIVDVVFAAVANRRIPLRITHNDTKFNNVLLDDRTGEALCVVDLDTVMPGSVLYDFGDLVRTSVSPTAEDARNLSRVRLRMPVFKQLVQGYLDRVAGYLTSAERSLLGFAGQLITFETGIRFLTDYLNGDNYFRIHRPAQNLDRCRCQFKLVESLEAQQTAMQRTVNGHRGKSEARKPRGRRVPDG